MPPVRLPSVLLAIALWATLGLASIAVASDLFVPSSAGSENVGDYRIAAPLERWRGLAVAAATGWVAMIGTGYQRAPALVLALSALLLVPAAAVVSFAARAARAQSKRRAFFAALAASRESTRGTQTPDPDLPAWSSQAWLSIEGEASGAHAIAGDMLRIGRHHDNDVRLPLKSVHRYHAVIHRTCDAGFVITDLSGEHGNGVRIHGQRRAQAPLVHGDEIELGMARMPFASTSQ
jgi:hypothetical protein